MDVIGITHAIADQRAGRLMGLSLTDQGGGSTARRQLHHAKAYLPRGVASGAVEAGVSDDWRRYIRLFSLAAQAQGRGGCRASPLVPRPAIRGNLQRND